MSTAGLPLEGIRVLDFSHAAAGPYATMILADLGADVIKVEKPGRGDGARHMGKPMLGPLESDYYVSINRNKRAVALNLHTDEGIDVARRLAGQSDVVLQNFRPGVMDRLGLGFDDLKTRRPGLIYASISAFGASGPLSDRPANDIIMQAMSGLMGITGEVGGGPVRIGAPVSDYTTGMYTVIGVMAALQQREAKPEGQHVEVAMLDATLAIMANYIPAVASAGTPVPRVGRGHAQIVPYQAFECSDGNYVMVGAFTQGFWRRLCDALGHPEWPQDPRFATNADRLAHRADLISLLEEIFRTRTREEWLEVLTEADVPGSPVYELHEAIHTDQARHNNVLQEVGTADSPCPTVRLPIRSTGWSLAGSQVPPRIGQDTAEVLHELLGEDSAAIDGLVARGAVGVEESVNA